MKVIFNKKKNNDDFGLIIFKEGKNINGVIVDDDIRKQIKDKKSYRAVIKSLNLNTPFNIINKNIQVYKDSLSVSFDHNGKSRRVVFKYGSPIFNYAIKNGLSEAFKKFILKVDNNNIYRIEFKINGIFKNKKDNYKFYDNVSRLKDGQGLIYQITNVKLNDIKATQKYIIDHNPKKLLEDDKISTEYKNVLKDTLCSELSSLY